MKRTGLLFVILVLTNLVMARSSKQTIETLPYKVVKSYKNFEIREYSSALFSYVELNAKRYSKASSEGFRKLAGYIFGGNEEQKQIAMTSPVEMELNDGMTMKFMVPSEFEMEDLPKPNDPDVQFVKEPGKYVAAIEFGGYANDRNIKYFKKLLKKALAQQAIKHTGEFSFLGYNSPFEIFNRRNEIVVEVVV